MAINVPLPTKRPEYRATQVTAPAALKSPDTIGALLAMNQSNDELADNELDRLSGQPVLMPVAALASVPVPTSADRVRTSPKTARVEQRGQQLAAAPVVVPAPQLQAGYWPLEVDRGVTGAIASAKAPRLSASFIRTAPLQAYVDGFNADRTPVDHKRFTPWKSLVSTMKEGVPPKPKAVAWSMLRARMPSMRF